MVKDAWSEWEWRDHLADHDLAPNGLTKCCLNNRYSIQFYQKNTEWGLIDHLIIRRHDEKPVRSWIDLQRIKNELVGSDRTAVEVFPAEDDLVDQANLYHLWVLPEGFKLPFGLHFRGFAQGPLLTPEDLQRLLPGEAGDE
jgi:hypothetical protein